MWYGHHPFFLFLIPSLIGEKIQEHSVKKKIQEEQAIEQAIKLQNTEEQSVSERLERLKEYYKQLSKEAKPHFLRLGVSTLVLFVSLLVEDVPAILAVLAFLSVIGVVVFGVTSFVYYVNLENISSNICALEDELKRRKRGHCNSEQMFSFDHYNQYLNTKE